LVLFPVGFLTGTILTTDADVDKFGAFLSWFEGNHPSILLNFLVN
jgi:hypothetical protein